MAKRGITCHNTMSDYNFLMESRFAPAQLQVVNYLSRSAAAQGLNLYLAGGAVRDLTQGQQPIRGLDFVVEGNTQKLLRQLEHPETPRNGLPGELQAPQPLPEIDSLETEKHLGTLRVHFRNGIRVEIASAHTEIFPKPGASPKTSPAMIFDDLKRRDFSVNAMAISLHPNSRGLLLDPTNGAADIERRELRILNSRGFVEDPSRLYRLIRLGLRLDFKPDERTRSSFESALENRASEQMAAECRGRELRAILEEENPAKVFKALADQGLLAGLDPKLASTRIAYDQFGKIRAALKLIPSADPILLHFHAMVEKLDSASQKRLARLVFWREDEVKAALNLSRDAQALGRALASSKASKPSQVYGLVAGKPLPLLVYLLVYVPQVSVQKRIKDYLAKVPLVRARQPRSELQALGMPLGSKFEKVMEKIFLEDLDGNLKTPQEVTKALIDLSGLKPQVAPTAPKPKPEKKTQSKKPAAASALVGAKPRNAAPPANASPVVKAKSKAATRHASQHR